MVERVRWGSAKSFSKHVFNLGYPRLSKFVKFIDAMQKGDWKKASEEMIDSKWASQVGRRAIRLQQMVIHGEK